MAADGLARATSPIKKRPIHQLLDLCSSEIILKNICSRGICGWPLPNGREIPITAASDPIA
jgi:hypothetical protein